MLKKVCVFCSASGSLDPQFYEAADALGAALAKNSYDLVYGGSRSGMMGRTADSALSNGGDVTGVIPDFLVDKERAHQGIQTLHITKTMHERQLKMSDLSDAFIIMPGGMGTLAEFFEVVTWRTLGVFDKPIILVNIAGYWDDLIAMIRKTSEMGFLHKNFEDIFCIVHDVKGAINALDELSGRD